MKLTPTKTRNPWFLIAMLAMLVCGFGVSISSADDSNVENQQTESEEVDSEEAKPNDPYGLREKPDVGKNIGVRPKEGDYIDGGITFYDEENRFVEIGRYLDGDQPVMLSFNYSNCPKLCSVQLENMTATLLSVDFKVGEDFQVVSVSIDPNEQTSRSKKTKAKYTEQYNKPGTEDGWHFLTGKKANIKKLTDTCGFEFKYVPAQKLFSHPPVFILVSPEGKIVRYIHGLDYDADTIEQALIESAEGKIGSPINIINYGLGCFLFDPSTGKYSFQAMAVMRIGALITVVALVFGVVPYWFLRRGNRDEKPDPKKPIKSSVPPDQPAAGTV